MTEPANDSAPKPPVFGWLRRLRFSLRSLVLLVLLLASLPVLWMRWDAWEKVKVLGHHARSGEIGRSPDGALMLGNSRNIPDGLALFNAHTGVPIAELEDSKQITATVFSPDSRWLLCVEREPVIHIWETAAGKRVGELSVPSREFVGQKAGNYPLAGGRWWTPVCSSDGQLVAAAVPGEGVYVWSFAERELKLKIPAPVSENGLGAPAFSSDGTRLIVPEPETSATIWETETGRALGEVSGHRNQIEIAKFSADDSKILTYSLARSEIDAQGGVIGPPSYWNYSEIRIWDAHTFKLLKVMFEHDGYDVDFSADGEDLVIKEYGGEIVQWHARRPGWWWGVAWLPEFWLTALFAFVLAWSLRRDWKMLRADKS